MKLKMPAFIKTTQKSMSKHSPEILTGIGVVGMVTTVVLAVKATPKALEQINDAEGEKIAQQLEQGVDYEKANQVKLTPVETVKATWKTYLPAAITGVASIACVIGANSVNAKRNAALAATCQLTASTLAEYKKIVNDTVDDETKEVIKEKVAKETLKKNPVTKKDEKELRDQELILDNAHHLCYDAGGNLYFRSDEQTIRAAINRLNNRMNGGEPYVSLNDLYSELEVRGTDVGEQLGWNLYRDGIIEPDFDSQIASNGEPCIVLNYMVSPTYNYHRIEL